MTTVALSQENFDNVCAQVLNLKSQLDASEQAKANWQTNVEALLTDHKVKHTAQQQVQEATMVRL